MKLKQTEYGKLFFVVFEDITVCNKLENEYEVYKVWNKLCGFFFFVSAQMRTRVQCTHVHKRADASVHGGSGIECDREVKND